MAFLLEPLDLVSPRRQRFYVEFSTSHKGPFINDVMKGRGEGVCIFVTECDKRGEGVDANLTSH